MDISPELFFQLHEADRRGYDHKLYKKRFRLNVRKHAFSNGVIMVALYNRADHYIFILWLFLSFFLFRFFPRLISAVGDWMSTIFPYMVWP